ncbi:MAG: hypothetical protein V1917_02830 [Candidatus Gottesmanbacteria bacterium]
MVIEQAKLKGIPVFQLAPEVVDSLPPPKTDAELVTIIEAQKPWDIADCDEEKIVGG